MLAALADDAAKPGDVRAFADIACRRYFMSALFLGLRRHLSRCCRRVTICHWSAPLPCWIISCPAAAGAGGSGGMHRGVFSFASAVALYCAVLRRSNVFARGNASFAG